MTLRLILRRRPAVGLLLAAAVVTLTGCDLALPDLSATATDEESCIFLRH